MSNPFTTQEQLGRRARLQSLTQKLMNKIGVLSPEKFEKVIFKLKLQGEEFDEEYLRILYHSSAWIPRNINGSKNE